ncbi:DUF6233 domain-containing protein [Streptomyces sp. NPDC093221]|uniref:DUF6233 domain-containing protein n=1 Tax=Streptomyces sp. NPDC093221 TaxID=3366032 RepID=UPI0038205B19
MSELPPDLDRLRTVEVYLRYQLAAVQQKIAQAERKAQWEAGRPAPRHQPPAGMEWWRLQPMSGDRPAVLHRHGCPGSTEQMSPLNRGAARDALANPEIPATPCPRCRPDLALRED